MFRLWIYTLILSLFMMTAVVFAHHKNEKYCFDCAYKYKIGDKKNDTYELESDLQDNDVSKRVKEQLEDRKTGLVSYILFENNKLVVDQWRKSKYRWPYPSHSMGKSMVSLVTGYAKCGGYLHNNVYKRIEYPTVEGTLYENQRLIDLLHMRAGDQDYLGEYNFRSDSRWKDKGKSLSSTPIKSVMKRYFKDKPGQTPGETFNYSGVVTNVIMNYVIYKTGDDWEKLLHKVFVEDAKVAKRVYFHKSLNTHNNGNRKSGEYGRYSFYADRYDYLRIANLIMNHWNNDTCVGKYLKTMYDTRVVRDNYDFSKFKGNHKAAQTYGGQFLWDPLGLEDRPILMMDGAYGQQIIIDFDNKRIITIHSTDRHYDYYSLVYLALGVDGEYTDKNSKTDKDYSILDNLDPAKEITQN